jgi:phytanoyl-CoA hydroxylase
LRCYDLGVPASVAIERQRLTSEQNGFWRDNGYLILASFFSREEVQSVNSVIERRMADPASFGKATVDVLDGQYVGQRFRAAEAPDEVFRGPIKINDLFLDEPEVRNLALNERLTGVLSDLLDGPPLICNSLNFIWGSQQPEHVDSWFMPAPPAFSPLMVRVRRRLGLPIWNHRLVVSSVCLEDVHPDAGPLTFFPASHRIEPYRPTTGSLAVPKSEVEQCAAYVMEQVRKRGLRREKFAGRAGDVFLWHGQLMHGGSHINDQRRTRKTLVTHYWRAQDLDPARTVRVHQTGFYEKRTHQQTA